MENKHKNDINNLSNTVEIERETDNVTREINLDDLYDGAVNNTVVIDPVTNNEILLSSKKKNYSFIIIALAILALLLLYYINNKSDFGKETKKIESNTTTRVVTTDSNDSGTLICTYSSKSDAESQEITYTLSYGANTLIKSTFNYVVVSNTETSSAVIDDLKNQYENFFLNNAAVKGNTVTFEKNNLGFTFNVDTDYKNSNYEELIFNEGQTILFVKPKLDDTVDLLKEEYTTKGFSCQTSPNTEE